MYPSESLTTSGLYSHAFGGTVLQRWCCPCCRRAGIFFAVSLFPLLMVLNSLLGLAHLSEVTILNATQFLPEDVQQILVNYMTFLGSNDSVRPLLLGSCLTLYFLSRAVRSIMYSMRRIYRCSTDHTMLHNLLVSLVLTGGLLLLLGASIFLIVVGQEFLQLVMRWFPMLYSGLILVRYLGYPAAICIALVFFDAAVSAGAACSNGLACGAAGGLYITCGLDCPDTMLCLLCRPHGQL